MRISLFIKNVFESLRVIARLFVLCKKIDPDMTKSLVNFLLRIKNASMAHKAQLLFRPYKSYLKFAEILYREGLILSYNYYTTEFTEETYLVLNLRLHEGKVMTKALKLVSASRYIKILPFNKVTRLYLRHKVLVLSTSQGIRTHIDCLNSHAGGVVMFSC